MLTAVEHHFGPGRPYPTSHYGAVSNLLIPCPMTPLPTLNSATAVAMSAAEFARPHPKTAGRYNTSQASLRDDKAYGMDTASFHLRSPSILRHIHQSSLPPQSSTGRGPLKGDMNGDCRSERRASIEQNGPVNLATSTASSTAAACATALASSLAIPSSDTRRHNSPQSAFCDPVTNGAISLSQQQAQSHSEQEAIHRSIASLYGPPKMQFCPPPVSAGVNGPNAYQLNFPNMYSRTSVYG